MTQLEFTFESSTEVVLEAFKFHKNRVLELAVLIKDPNSATHPDFLDWLSDQEYSFSRYHEALAVLNDRGVY